MGVLMTGMGDDGAWPGRDPGSGGYTVAQSQETCVYRHAQGGDRTWVGDAVAHLQDLPDILQTSAHRIGVTRMRKRSSGQPAPEVTRVPTRRDAVVFK